MLQINVSKHLKYLFEKRGLGFRMDGTKFVPPIVSCSPPPLAPMSPPPMTDDSDGVSPDMGGFSFNALDNGSMGMGPPDLDSGGIEEFDIPNFNDIDDTDEYDVTGKI